MTHSVAQKGHDFCSLKLVTLLVAVRSPDWLLTDTRANTKTIYTYFMKQNFHIKTSHDLLSVPSGHEHISNELKSGPLSFGVTYLWPNATETHLRPIRPMNCNVFFNVWHNFSVLFCFPQCNLLWPFLWFFFFI